MSELGTKLGTNLEYLGTNLELKEAIETAERIIAHNVRCMSYEETQAIRVVLSAAENWMYKFRTCSTCKHQQHDLLSWSGIIDGRCDECMDLPRERKKWEPREGI